MPITIEGTRIDELNLSAANVATTRIEGVLVYREVGSRLAFQRVLHVNSRGSSFIEFDWDDVAGAASYYSEYRQSGASNWIGGMQITASQRRIVGLNSSTTYQIRVRAQNAGWQQCVCPH